MGAIIVIVPEGFDVELEGFSFMGGRDLKLRNVPRVPGSPRIRPSSASCRPAPPPPASFSATPG